MSTNDERGLNPYAPPETPLTPPPVSTSDALAEQEAIRRKYLNHEASVKSIGSLHILGGILYVFVLVVILSRWSDQGPVAPIGGIVVLAVVIVVNLVVGFGLTTLQSWARWTDMVLLGFSFVGSIFSLIGFMVFWIGERTSGMKAVFVGYGIGLLILGYVLYLLIAPKSSVVFSTGYREVIKATPHIKYKTSCLLKGLLLLLLGIFVLGIVGLVLQSR